MLALPRFRDSGFLYFILFVGILTTCYMVSYVTNRTTNLQLDSFNSSRRNYEYEEVCREWRRVLDLKDTTETSNTGLIDPTFVVQSLEDSSDLNSQFHCDSNYKHTFITQRGQYYVIYNFIKASEDFGCTESITLTAPGDFRFLDNVIPLVDRWQGPISIALYAPGHDFYTTLKSIAYLRNCETEFIKKLVTFHIFFDQDHTPKQQNGTQILDAYEDSYDCSIPPPWSAFNDTNLYKYQKGLLYPINVARNVAKLAAKTYFVFPSDIELYPTREFTKLFLGFVKENLDLFQADTKNVFVLPIFEILENQTVPENKTDLLEMLQKKTAIIFHQSVCIVCHRFIDSEKWVKSNETEGLGVFSMGKRTGKYQVWEPFFVCTQKEPLWDERFTWEGQNNKMVQAYTMCVMDYNFHVLDNAFLIHKPGVKKKKVQIEKFNDVVQKTTKLIKATAIQLQEIYGYNNNCRTSYSKMEAKKTK